MTGKPHSLVVNKFSSGCHLNVNWVLMKSFTAFIKNLLMININYGRICNSRVKKS